MADTVPAATRSVTCPRCLAEAMLIHAQRNTSTTPQAHPGTIFLCPNQCVVHACEMNALIDRHD